MRFLRSTIGIAGVLVAAGATAAAPQSVSPFLSSSLKRTVHGDVRNIDLSQWRMPLGGRLDLFAGADALSSSGRQYLSSGLRWRPEPKAPGDFQVFAMRTEGRASSNEASASGEGQTLVGIAERLQLGDAGYLPAVTVALAQASGAGEGPMPLAGRAVRLGLAGTPGAGHYSLSYYQADSEFAVRGSRTAAGERGLFWQAGQALGAGWQLDYELRLRQPSVLHPQRGASQRLTLNRAPGPHDVGRGWRLDARYGSAAARPAPPLAVDVASPTLGLREWRLDSHLGWYAHDAAAPAALPVDGGLWRVSARRSLEIGGLHARLSPTFALGQSSRLGAGAGRRAGLALGFGRAQDRIDFNVDYRSAAFSPRPDDSDLRMTLNFVRRSASLLPGLGAAASPLRLPWQRRR